MADYRVKFPGVALDEDGVPERFNITGVLALYDEDGVFVRDEMSTVDATFDEYADECVLAATDLGIADPETWRPTPQFMANQVLVLTRLLNKKLAAQRGG